MSLAGAGLIGAWAFAFGAGDLCVKRFGVAAQVIATSRTGKASVHRANQAAAAWRHILDALTPAAVCC